MSSTYKTYQQLIGDRPDFKLPFDDNELASKIRISYDAIIVLDDDPTGTQTVHDIPVLTKWTDALISQELALGTPLFFILTNTRSLTVNESCALTLEVAIRVKEAASALNKKCLVISRSDSTLRGHYPSEVTVLTEVFLPQKGVHFIVPAFFEGGRYTINNVHYVREGDMMIPAGETPFAKDKVFGYSSSNLEDWIIEKFNGDIDKKHIHHLSITALESQSSEELTTHINTMEHNTVCIVNATNYKHLQKAIYSIFSSNINPYFRTAASFIAAITQQKPKFIDVATMNLDKDVGGLTVLGSYVPKSTSQLNHVLENQDITAIEIDVASILKGTARSIESIAMFVDKQLVKNDVILYTSRTLISTELSEKNLDIGSLVSNYLTDVVASLSIAPRYIIGKGGITSSDIATRSLKIKKATVLGQMIPGVPVWDASAGSKFPETPFIIFPGNVGDHTALTTVIKKLQLETQYHEI